MVIFDERNWRWCKKDGKIQLFPGLEESYMGENVLYCLKQLQIQCHSQQNYQWHFSQNHIKDSYSVHGNTEDPRAKATLTKEEVWSTQVQIPWLQIVLQSYSNQDSMELVQKQKHRSMEQTESPEINPHMCSTNSWRDKNIQWRKGSVFNKWCREYWESTCKRMK